MYIEFLTSWPYLARCVWVQVKPHYSNIEDFALRIEVLRNREHRMFALLISMAYFTQPVDLLDVGFMEVSPRAVYHVVASAHKLFEDAHA